MRFARLAFVAGFVGLLASGGPGAVRAEDRPAEAAVRLEVEAPPELEAFAALAARVDPASFQPTLDLLGLESAGAPIRVLLAAEGSEQARDVPPWISGYAFGAAGLVVLLPERTPRYPVGGFEELLRHEVAHVLVARAAAGRSVPRWLDEGIATFAGRAWGLTDDGLFTFELLTNSATPLAELPALFSGEASDVRRAYAISAAFTRDLIARRGAPFVARALAEVGRGTPFSDAFRLAAAGRSLGDEEVDFWRRQRSGERWLPAVTSTVAVWMGITLLAIRAARSRRRKNAEKLARWAEEERAAVAEDRPADDVDRTVH